MGKEGVLADHLTIEDRFAGASKKKQEERFTGEEVMRGLPVDLFSDEEVLNLARLHSVESYSKFLLGMENGKVVASSDPRYLRAQELEAFSHLRAVFEAENQRRTERRKNKVPTGAFEERVPELLGMFERAGSAYSFMGSAETLRFFLSRDECFKQYWEELFSPVVKEPHLDSAVDVVNECDVGTSVLAVCLVDVPENMLRGTAGGTPVPLVIRLRKERCVWVVAETPDLERALAPHVKVQGFSRLVSDIVSALQTRGAGHREILTQAPAI